ncbi:hypothetical protein C2857_002112 [Epichloe festucae Fl1]|uniref:DNA polymerase lambda n=1 Tax=Epichloe festucae (strain Fl1) TaxID=877507 RepID=A0A7S9KRQ6_EPIFF|nr:hypothetical protein C2857_002112 [Epichloe festucae Fl1]
MVIQRRPALAAILKPLTTETHAEMALTQPSLRDKLAHFDSMKRSSEESGDSDDGDGFAAAEQLDRQRRMSFFLNSQSAPVGSTVLAAEDVANDRRHHHHPVRREEARTTTTPIIKATQQQQQQQQHTRTRVHELLDSTGDETVIPETARVSKTQQRKVRTPLPLPRHLDSAMTMDSPSLKAIKGKKRKRESLNIRPEREQMFKDLQFYYIPNDDIAPARRLRINKAREFGASWTRDPMTATHIIVEKDIAYSDVKKIIGAGGPNTKVVVNEEYPVDCIRFRSVLDYSQKKYRVPGQPLEIQETEEGQEVTATIDGQPTSSNESTSSLEVKPQHRNARKWGGHIAELGTGTPSRSNEGSNDGGAVGKGIESAPAAVDSQPLSLEVMALEIMGDASETGDTTGKNREHRGDELSQYITMMQEFKDLPLDHDEDDDDTRSSATDQGEQHSDEEEGSRSEDEQETPKGVKKNQVGPKNKATRFEDRFACNQAGAQNAGANNPNSRTIEVLQSMADYYDRVSDHWRTMGYRKAITTLKRHDSKITTEEEAFKLPHIGRRIAQKIEEIVTTNELRRLKYAEEEPTDSALQLFLKIYGVGTKQAQQWLSKGYRTLDDVKTKAKLNPSQRIGVDHLDDLNTRIPRREVEALGAYVEKAAAKVDPLVKLIIGGSYRRGSPSSNDIDLIVTKTNTDSVSQLRPFLTELTRVLTDDGFLTARLASFHSRADGSKFHGCCVLPRTRGINDGDHRPVWRRIDFLLVPETEMGGALIYFTGNDIFNRSMRLLASKKGMRLNQRGLYINVLRGAAREKVTMGQLVEGRCERRIFEILGVKWREPRERWC